MNLTALQQGSLTADDKLVSVKRRYYLVINNTDTEIPKPDGWVSLNVSLQRDDEWHGFTYEGSENSLLRFHLNEGAELLKAEYELHAMDAEVFIKEIAGNGVDAVVEWEGRLDFSKYRFSNNIVEMPAERKSISNVIENRWADDIKYDATETSGGLSTTGFIPSPVIVGLHGQAILEKYLNEQKGIDVQDWTELRTTSNRFYLQMATISPTVDEIQLSNEFEMAMTIEDPVSRNRYVLKPQYAGNFTFSINIEFQFDTVIIEKAVNITDPQFDIWQMGFQLQIGNNVFQLTNESGFGTSYYAQETNVDTPIGTKTLKFTYTGTHYVQANQPIFIFGKLEVTPSNNNYRGLTYYMKNLNTVYDIQGASVSSSSLSYGYLLRDALDFTTHCISEGELQVVSDFYGSNGCGYKRVLTNGLGLRQVVDNIDVSGKPKGSISLREILYSLQAIDGTGFGYEQLNDGTELIRVEPRSYFYRDVLIMDLSPYQDSLTYLEEVAIDKIYSEVSIGYEKFPSEDVSGLDEFNTEHIYKLPVKYHSNTLIMKSPLIAAGYEIERMRRKRLTEDSKESTDSDDKNFIVCVRGVANQTFTDVVVDFRKPYDFQYGVEDIGGGQLIATETPIDPGNTFLYANADNLLSGSTIVISGSTLNNGSFTIIKIEHIQYLNTYVVFVDNTVVEELNQTVTITVQQGSYAAEKNEDFEVLNDSVLDPSTSYNLRLNPRYMLLANAELVNVGLKRKALNDKITPFRVVHNKKFEIQRKLSDNCIQNDPNRLAYVMDEPMTLSQFLNRESLYYPERVTMTFFLQPEQVRYIVRCHRNMSTNNDNYGYFTFTNPDGLQVEGYLLNLTIVEQGQSIKCEMSFVKKKVNTI